MFNNLKCVSTISLITLLVSCQTEEATNPEQESLEVNEVQIIDKAYEDDLESLKNVPIMFENVQYSIEEVLTNTNLFEIYETANTHYLEENLDTKTQVLHIIKTKEAADKILIDFTANSQSAKSLATNEVATIDVLVRLYDNNNLGGSDWQWSVKGTENINGLQLKSRNVSSSRRNKANSYKATINTNTQENRLTFYANTNRGGSNFHISSSKTVNNLSGTSVGNDNIAGVSFEYGFR